ncbi:MAG: acyl-[acyl-carrier-protein] thioesterase [Calditrichaceae bacterium]
MALSENGIWHESFKVRAYEVDPTGRATIQSICNYFQETAGNHASDLGVSVDALIKKGLTWVLSRLHVQVTKYPFWRQELRLETWPSGLDHLYAIRDFKLFNEAGQLISIGTSSWMLLDIDARKPIRMPDFMKEIRKNSGGRALPDEFHKLPQMERTDHETLFNVRLSDLDMNQHVNNVNYIEWGLESVPTEFRDEHHLAGMEVSFRAESVYGDRVISRSEIRDENTLIHRLIREGDERELAQMRTKWIKK